MGGSLFLDLLALARYEDDAKRTLFFAGEKTDIYGGCSRMLFSRKGKRDTSQHDVYARVQVRTALRENHPCQVLSRCPVITQERTGGEHNPRLLLLEDGNVNVLLPVGKH